MDESNSCATCIDVNNSVAVAVLISPSFSALVRETELILFCEYSPRHNVSAGGQLCFYILQINYFFVFNKVHMVLIYF